MYNENILADVIPADKKVLLSAIESKTISHAYLFTGEDITSVENSYREFLCMVMSDVSQRELMLERITKKTHSDIADIYPDGATIKISQLRGVAGILQTEPAEGQYNVLIIHEAEKMTKESQNFLLKTIEEPPENALIILLAANQDSLLGTILSRVTIISVKDNTLSLDNRETRSFVANRMSALILEGHIEGIFSTAKALMNSAQENSKELTQKQIALKNLEYVYSFFVQMLIYNKTKKEKEYSQEDFGMLAGKIGTLCNMNIIDIIKETMDLIAKNASVQLTLESMLIRILEECNAENSWNQI